MTALRLATLRETRAALAAVGFPTTAHDAEIRALLAFTAPMVSMGLAENPETAALLAKDQGTRIIHDAESMLSVDLVGAGAHETRAMSESEQAALDGCKPCGSIEHFDDECRDHLDDADDGGSRARPMCDLCDTYHEDDEDCPDDPPVDGVGDLEDQIDAIISRPRTPAERDAYDHDDPHAWVEGLNDARQNDIDADELDERTRR